MTNSRPAKGPERFLTYGVGNRLSGWCATAVKSWVVVYLFSNLGLVSWRWFRGHLGDKG